MRVRSHSLKVPSFLQSRNLSCTAKRQYLSLRSPTLDPFDKPTIELGLTTDIQSGYNPIVDEEITTVVAIGAHRDVSTKELPIIELPPLPQVNDPSFEMILSAKLELCSQNLDFSSPDKQLLMKDQKKKTLNEFLTFFEKFDKKKVQNVSGTYLRAFFRMLNKNIIRKDPKFPGAVETFNYALSVLEPSWPHLSMCYQLLTKFITLFQDAEFVNLAFLRKIIFLMQLPDSNERAQLANFIKNYFLLHPESQKWILTEIKNALINLSAGQLSPFALMPLLLVLYHILSKRIPELEDEIRKIFSQYSLPLLGFTYINQQYPQLKKFYLTTIKIYPDLTVPLMKEIQKKWPRQNGLKRHLMLDLLISVAELMNKSDFSRIASSFFAFLNNELLTDHVKIIERILQIFISEESRSWISVNSIPAIDEMYNDINYMRLNHWNPAIKQQCEIAIKKMQDMNPTEIERFRASLTKKNSFASNLETFFEKKSAYSIWIELLQYSDENVLDEAQIKEYFRKARSVSEVRFIPTDFKPGPKKPEIAKTTSLKKDNSLQTGRRNGLKRPVYHVNSIGPLGFNLSKS